ncbi:hypothetical protein TKK_0009046 [Trichogramma kaykai]|uniref:GCF C-terminal domain-containing protein n=1 Tax=Trichogramma kaykai TaxID=54128 RepID=A0ABD2X3R5_9HYME
MALKKVQVSAVWYSEIDSDDLLIRPSFKRQWLQLEEVESVAETFQNCTEEAKSYYQLYCDEAQSYYQYENVFEEQQELDDAVTVAEIFQDYTDEAQSYYQYEHVFKKQQELDDNAVTDDETITASTCKESQKWNAQWNKEFEDFLDAVDKITEVNSEGLNIQKTVEALMHLKEKYCMEYKLFRVGDLACSVISSKLEDYLYFWNPLCQPTLPLSLFEEWKEFLENEALYNNKLCTTRFDQLVWDSWMLTVQIAIQNWMCYQPERLVHLIKLWKNILPSRILKNILEIIFQKLKSTVEKEWSPVTDKLPIRTWIYPWLRFMHKKIIAEIYPIIHEKLGKAVVCWEPSDTIKEDIENWYNEWFNMCNDKQLIESIIKEPPLKIVFYHSQEEDTEGLEMS